MEEFIRIFLNIDRNNNNEITTKELIDYAHKNNLSETIVPRWKRLFDPQNTGVITLSNFLDSLGLKMNEYLIYKQNITEQKAASLQLPSDVQKIAGDLPIEKQITVVEQVRKLQSLISAQSYEKAAKALKKYLDEHYGSTWHVLIIHKSFASAFTHEVETSFTFKMLGVSLVVWKTQEKPKPSQ